MRATRGLMASMGAATCLILAGTLALTLLSGVIAFRGWPGAGVQGGGEQQALVTRARAVADAQTTAPARLRVPALRTASTSTGRPRPRAQATARRTARRGRPAAGAPAATQATPGAGILPGRTANTPSGLTASATNPLAVPRPPTSTGESVRRLGERLGQTVTTTQGELGQVIKPVAPQAATAVQQTTTPIGGAVQSVTDAVGQGVDGLGVPLRP